MTTIDYSTVNKIFRGEEDTCNDKLINKFAKTLFEFFKLHDFGEVYVLQNCTTIATDLNLKSDKNGRLSKHSAVILNRFNTLGIYFDVINNPKNYVKPVVNYVVLDNMFVENLCNDYDNLKGSLKSALAKSINGIDFSREYTYCIVNNNLENKNLYNCNKIIEEVERTFKQVMFLNKDLYTIQSSGINTTKNINVDFYRNALKTSKTQKCEFMNLYKPIYEYCIKNTNIIDNAIGARRLLYELLNAHNSYHKKGYNLVFYYKIDPSVELRSIKDTETVINNMEHIYASFYALLTTKYHCSCIKTASNSNDITFSTAWLLAQDNMYAKDYLEMLDKFPDVTTYYSDEMGYYCVIDRDKLKRVDPNLKRDYRFELTMINIKYNPETKRWISSNVEETNYDYYSIKPLDFHNYFNLSAEDSDETKAVINSLSTLAKQFQDTLGNKGIVPSEVIHQGNLLLYEYNGCTYLGFISSISRKLPFILYPMDDSYEPFKIDLSNSYSGSGISINKLQSIFTDLDLINTLNALAQKGAKFSTKRLTFKLGDYADGIIFVNILYEYFIIKYVKDLKHIGSKSVFATIDELGIWCESARQFRKNSRTGDSAYYNSLVKSFDMDSLRKKNYLTFFGGPHPYSSTQIALRPNLIKYTGDNNEWENK